MTAVTTAKLGEQFEFFLKTFKEVSGEFKYRSRISQLPSLGAKSLLVDFEDVSAENPEIAQMLVAEPDDVLKAFDRAAYETLRVESPAYAERIRKELRVRIRHLPERLSPRKVTTEHLRRLVAIAGMVVRASELKPLAVIAAFKCRNDHTTRVEQSTLVLKKPNRCDVCGETRIFELDDKSSVFIDYQVIRLQELPEELPPGQLPQTFDVDLTSDVVNTARPGDRVVLTGIVRADPEYSQAAGKLRLFRSRIDGNFVEVLGKEPEQIQITKEDEALIRKISSDPNAYERLIQSIAPAIYGYETQKEAVLLQVEGAPQKILPDGTTLRGDLNILLVGDPGTAKSELLKYTARIAPRGLYTSGRGSTAAGLTAAVIKERTGMMMLEAGALVLADQGTACIDEFDKMRPEDRNALHETMEQQSYHPSVEILLANGRRVSIGAYVDRLFEAHREQVILGKDCEILRLVDLPPLYAFDPETRQVRKTQIDRVSRHAAPTEFVRIQYSNGRHILVTPDHPTLVWREEAIRNVPASNVGVGDFVPAVRQLPNSATAVVLEDAKLQRVHEKSVRLQSSLTPELASILGFLLTEGYAYKGRTTEIGFTNTDSELLQRFRSLMQHEFELVPIADENQAGVIILRYVSTRLYRWLATNFDELLHTAREKRIPSLIMGASAGIAAAFLRAAFRGDGSVEPEAVCFRTASAGLARDYQDLFLKLGISSHITPDRTNVSFKVYVVAHSLRRFAALLLERTDSRYLQVQGMIQRSQRVHRRHDVLPTDVGPTIRHLYRALGLPYGGYFDEHVKGGFGIAVETMLRFAKLLRERLETVRGQLAANTTLRMLRERLGWSQSALAAAVGVPRSRIAYAEAGGYSNNARKTLTVRCVAAVKRVLENAEDKLNHLDGITALRFLRITSVEIIRNEGPARTEWVYDLTVEPYHTFVSHGVILHNTVSVAKGGIVATLNARTSLLAAANPVLGKYDPYRNITDNVNLPIPLLTRFDLIFVLRDVPERDRDEALAKHVLEIHRRGEYVSAPPIEFEMLKKYLAYAKKVVPVLTKDAEEKMLDYYLQMRSMGSESMITVTPRQLEAIIRLATARARLLLREKVTEEDAMRAISLMRRMLESYAGVDAKTGKFDLGVLHGRPLSERNLLEIALDTFKALEGPEKNPVEGKRFVEELVKTKKFSQDEAQRYLQMLNRSGQIYEVKPGFYRKL